VSHSQQQHDLLDKMFTIVTTVVDSKMVNPDTNKIVDAPVQWAVDYIDFLLSGSLDKHKHSYVPEMTAEQIHSVCGSFAIRLIIHLVGKISNQVNKSKETTKWLSELGNRVNQLSTDKDPVLRKKVFEIDFEDVKTEPAGDEQTGFSRRPRAVRGARGARSARQQRGGFGRGSTRRDEEDFDSD